MQPQPDPFRENAVCRASDETPAIFKGVVKADTFEMVSFEKAREQVSRVCVSELCAWLVEVGSSPAMLFDSFRTECPEVAIVREATAVPSSLWIIGDLHADLLTLVNLVAYAEQNGRAEGIPPAFLFLGDIVDRGIHDHETLIVLLDLIRRSPGRVCVISGNHDLDLQWSDQSRGFVTTLQPAEYAEQLNRILHRTPSERCERIALAQLVIPFFQTRPKAVILPDGTLLAHGGFPHTDTHTQIRTPADLGNPTCLSDFVWGRIAENPRKRPNRGNRGHEQGWTDFAQFCELAPTIGLPPIRRMIRGHDHYLERWRLHPGYDDYPVLTLNAMGRRLEGEPNTPEGQHPLPVIAHYRPHQLPLVVQLPLCPREVDSAFEVLVNPFESEVLPDANGQQRYGGGST